MGAWVALGDSSGYPTPGHGSRRFHWPSQRDEAVSACGRTVIGHPDISTSSWAAPDDVDPVLRCRSNGCRQRWSDE